MSNEKISVIMDFLRELGAEICEDKCKSDTIGGMIHCARCKEVSELREFLRAPASAPLGAPKLEADSERVPAGFRRIEAYTDWKTVVVMGDPYILDGENHNCDAMGCGGRGHVLARLPIIPAESAGAPLGAGEALDLEGIETLYDKGQREFLTISDTAILISSIPVLIARLRASLSSVPVADKPEAVEGGSRGAFVAENALRNIEEEAIDILDLGENATFEGWKRTFVDVRNTARIGLDALAAVPVDPAPQGLELVEAAKEVCEQWLWYIGDVNGRDRLGRAIKRLEVAAQEPAPQAEPGPCYRCGDTGWLAVDNLRMPCPEGCKEPAAPSPVSAPATKEGRKV